MARKRMVTRTIKATEVNCLCLNIETAEPFNKTIVLTGAVADDKVALKQCKKYDSDTEKIVAVVDMNTIEALYGMPEEDFVKVAEILPPRCGNNDEAEAEEE